MPTYRVKKCTYTHGNARSTAQWFSVQGKTESAVKAQLQKRHRGKEITIIEIIWA
ncbi:MAG: hypothetical protein MPL62_14975 [Alphaproteobacteria bacterium]|nr:hypothetical protein [Alphaproteobacteria bacterium]